MDNDLIKQHICGLLSLSVYGNLLKRPPVSMLLDMLRALERGDDFKVCESRGMLCRYLIKDGRAHSLEQAIACEILSDENPFTIQLANGTDTQGDLLGLARRDLDILYRAAKLTATLQGQTANLPPLKEAPSPEPLDRPWHECMDALSDFHRKKGVGEFIKYRAFLWTDGDMRPICHPDPIRLCDLKDYETQRQTAINNTLAFLDGYGANNMLLYGDRGTGKSSTVKALLNQYWDRGLRMVQMPKESLNELPELTARLANIPMKFIVFIDDLSFSGSDDNFAALKAVLEGGLSSLPQNVLIYATSNRRHLLRETFSGRGDDEIHRADTVQESVSLSDRFGIFLTFLMPDRQSYLKIIEQLADDYKLNVERNALLDAAERWALERGARSPRFARQFIVDAKARLTRGQPL